MKDSIREQYEPTLRAVFRGLNHYFMVPAFRLGLGPFIGSPYGGYIMVLKTVGCKTGKIRYAPVNYAIINGRVYCCAGFGAESHWYRNMKAQPQIELIMPGGVVTGIVEDVADPAEWLCALRQVLQNGGFAGFFMGFNPYTAPDEVVRRECQNTPVVRVRTETTVRSGPGDPGGWLWIVSMVITIAAVVLGQRILFPKWGQDYESLAKRAGRGTDVGAGQLPVGDPLQQRVVQRL